MTEKFNFTSAQGDVYFERMPDDYVLPSDAIEVLPEGSKLIITHSETGHHHLMDVKERPQVKMYKLPKSITDCLLIVNETTVLEHNRSFDQHEPIEFSPGKYKVTRQRQYTAEGFKVVQD